MCPSAAALNQCVYNIVRQTVAERSVASAKGANRLPFAFLRPTMDEPAHESAPEAVLTPHDALVEPRTLFLVLALLAILYFVLGRKSKPNAARPTTGNGAPKVAAAAAASTSTGACFSLHHIHSLYSPHSYQSYSTFRASSTVGGCR